MDAQEDFVPGRQGILLRKARIKDLLQNVKGSRKWTRAFIEEFPAFDTKEGGGLLLSGMQGRTDDPALLAALEIWIPKILEEQPDWLITKSETLPQP